VLAVVGDSGWDDWAPPPVALPPVALPPAADDSVALPAADVLAAVPPVDDPLAAALAAGVLDGVLAGEALPAAPLLLHATSANTPAAASAPIRVFLRLI
jgi:hypothetical protein